MLALLLLLPLLSDVAPPSTLRPREPEFHGSRQALPPALVERARKYSWRAGCPVALDQLTLLRIDHYGYDGQLHRGELVVASVLAEEVLSIFADLFRLRFPIEKLRPIEDYQGSDDASMQDNNTSAFNCREVAGKPGVLSRHAFGRAIDINPLVNPYVTPAGVFPPAGARYLREKIPGKGILRAGHPVIRVFTRRGWRWGGDFRTSKDYQHFEK